MGEYVLVDRELLDGALRATANKIRSKTGKTDQLLFDMNTGYESAVDEIQTGASINNQDIIVEANGTYTADEGYTGLGSVTVSIPTSGTADSLYRSIIERTITEINDQTSPTVGTSAFECCKKLKTANFAAATYADVYAFSDCSTLTEVHLPAATSTGTYVFNRCTALKIADMPNLTGLATAVFYQCSALETLDFPYVKSIGNQTFRLCSSLKALVLRKADAVCTLSSTNSFDSTPIASGTGYIYVPSVLIETYKTTAQWSTFASQFRALEDYTVDGTITGKLDESKIA